MHPRGEMTDPIESLLVRMIERLQIESLVRNGPPAVLTLHAHVPQFRGTGSVSSEFAGHAHNGNRNTAVEGSPIATIAGAARSTGVMPAHVRGV